MKLLAYGYPRSITPTAQFDLSIINSKTSVNILDSISEEISEKCLSTQYRKGDLKSSFVQCPRCSSWVCRKSCWNIKRGLCKGCAPDLGVEMSAAQASRSVEEVWAHAAMAEEDKRLGEKEWRETIYATCPQCETPLATNAKFCPECGMKLKGSACCPQCEVKLDPGAKFCPECGHKIA